MRMNALKASAIFLSLFVPYLSHAAHAEAIGRVADRYVVGETLYVAGFNEPDEWSLQVENSNSETTPKVLWDDGVLDLYMPYRGCTALVDEEVPRANHHPLPCALSGRDAR